MVPLIREGGEDQLLLISKALESERPEHWANDTCVVHNSSYLDPDFLICKVGQTTPLLGLWLR